MSWEFRADLPSPGFRWTPAPDAIRVAAFERDRVLPDPKRLEASAIPRTHDVAADLVFGCGSRCFPDALPAHARLGNRLVLTLLRLLLGARLGDLPSFKAIRADALRRLEMREMTYGWTVEMLVKPPVGGCASKRSRWNTDRDSEANPRSPATSVVP